MSLRFGKCLCFVVLVFVTVSCTELQPAREPVEGMLPAVQLEYPDSVPLAWGRLVAVVATGNISRLWFEAENGEIHIAAFRNRDDALVPIVRVIGRQGDEQ